MKILIVGLKKNPQVLRIIEEGKKRGHTVHAVLTTELIINASKDRFYVELKNKDLSSYDLIYLWAISQRRWDWFQAAYYLNKNFNTKIVNNKAVDPSYLYYLTPASEYEKQTELQLNYPKTSIILSKKNIDYVLKSFGLPVIVKASPGRQGKTVYKCNSKRDIEKVIEENNDTAQSFIIREFIPNDGDLRVFVVGYRAIGAMKRTPKVGDFRSNISQGGSGEDFDLDSNVEIKKMAEAIAKATRTEIAGVDIMINKKTNKPYILEVNPGPQFTGFEQYTKKNAALEIIKYFESLARN